MATTIGDFSVPAGAPVQAAAITFAAETAKTANYQVLVGDVGTLFTTAGASGEVDFTLPAIAANLGPFEFHNQVDQIMKVISTEGTNMILDNNASATSLAFSTSSHKLGGRVSLQANAAGTKWLVRSYGPPSCTMTVA